MQEPGNWSLRNAGGRGSSAIIMRRWAIDMGLPSMSSFLLPSGGRGCAGTVTSSSRTVRRVLLNANGSLGKRH